MYNIFLEENNNFNLDHNQKEYIDTIINFFKQHKKEAVGSASVANWMIHLAGHVLLSPDPAAIAVEEYIKGKIEDQVLDAISPVIIFYGKQILTFIKNNMKKIIKDQNTRDLLKTTVKYLGYIVRAFISLDKKLKEKSKEFHDSTDNNIKYILTLCEVEADFSDIYYLIDETYNSIQKK